LAVRCLEERCNVYIWSANPSHRTMMTMRLCHACMLNSLRVCWYSVEEHVMSLHTRTHEHDRWNKQGGGEVMWCQIRHICICMNLTWSFDSFLLDILPFFVSWYFQPVLFFFLQVSVSVYFCLFPSTNKAPPEIIKKKHCHRLVYVCIGKES
jgi:hypothetical protein